MQARSWVALGTACCMHWPMRSIPHAALDATLSDGDHLKAIVSRINPVQLRVMACHLRALGFHDSMF